ncbi:MAG: sporulation protein YqfD [Clostridia bacterium]|nr:sporulation protein YqfD [Clostridia bacterium]
MISIFRYVSGYVEFCAEGGFPERFLNLCKLNGISLWNVENDGVKVKACTSAKEFENISKPAKNSGMTVKTLENKGIPFWARRHKWRCGLLAGLIIAVCLVWYMSGFVWDVEIAQEEGVKINNFTETLAELGVKSGVRKSKIDVVEVQEALLDMYPELSWVSLNIFGDKIKVEYTPATPAPEIVDTKAPSNIVASKSGKIVLIEGYNGTNAVKEGAYVTQGSLLISGVNTNGDGSENIVRARGKVFAETKNTLTSTSEYENSLNISNGISLRYKIDLFGLKIPLGIKPKTETVTETDSPLRINSTILPVGVIRDEGISFSESNGEYSSQEIDMLNLLYCINEKRNAFKDAKIKAVSYKKNETEQGRKLTMTVVCVENIALEKPVYVE